MAEFEFLSVLISMIFGLGLTHVLVFWAISHYLLTITLYPPDEVGFTDFEAHRHWFLWAFIGMGFMDIAQTAMRGDIFRPWYYLPFVLHYTALALIALFDCHSQVQPALAGRRSTSSVQRTQHRIRALAHHVRVDLRGLDVLAAEQFLHRADVVAALEQVRGEAVTERRASTAGCHAGFALSLCWQAYSTSRTCRREAP